MTAAVLLALIEAGTAPAILDVRTQEEFELGHVPGAVNIPFQQVSLRLDDAALDPDEPLVVYCGHGPRAWLAARALRRRGFTGITYLSGHMAAWRRAGLREDRGRRV